MAKRGKHTKIVSGHKMHKNKKHHGGKKRRGGKRGKKK